jgi:hypothetical protein
MKQTTMKQQASMVPVEGQIKKDRTTPNSIEPG